MVNVNKFGSHRQLTRREFAGAVFPPVNVSSPLAGAHRRLHQVTSNFDFKGKTLPSRIRDSEPHNEKEIEIRRTAPGSASGPENLLLAECVTSVSTNARWAETGARLTIRRSRICGKNPSMKNYRHRQRSLVSDRSNDQPVPLRKKEKKIKTDYSY